jgi:hypothetical protein
MRHDMKPERWSAISNSALSEQSIRAFHQPPSHYRVALYTHPAGTELDGRQRAGRVYVLSGGCQVTMTDGVVHLETNEFVDLPAGDYRFQVLGDRECKVVHVWLLPPDF